MAEVSSALGRALAEYYFSVEPALWQDLYDSGAFAQAPAARAEWECLALHACVRGLVAAGGFHDATADTLDAMHEAVLERWTAEGDPAAVADRRTRVADRYAEYGRIGHELDGQPLDAIAAALGAAAAKHAFAPAKPEEEALMAFAHLHGAMTEGAVEVVRRAQEAGA
ncbi:MAG: hypothetical protein U0704_01030 [Candidatus Eisenbacteria bacterium]